MRSGFFTSPAQHPELSQPDVFHNKVLMSNAQLISPLRDNQTEGSTECAPRMTSAAKGASTKRVNATEVSATRRIPRIFNQVMAAMTLVPISQRSSGGISPRR